MASVGSEPDSNVTGIGYIDVRGVPYYDLKKSVLRNWFEKYVVNVLIASQLGPVPSC